MKKYRIMKFENKYKIQYKTFLFWHNIKFMRNNGLQEYYFIKLFDTVDDCWNYIELEELDRLRKMIIVIDRLEEK
jgi:hypothetical protein